MDKEQTVTYILQYLNVSEKEQEQVSSVIRGAYSLFPTMSGLIEHVRECMKRDYGKKRNF